MTQLVFNSVFSGEILSYLKEREKSGYKNSSYFSFFRKFDQFCEMHKLTEISFTRELAEEIRIKPEHLSPRTHYSYLCTVKRFLESLIIKGYSICTPRLIAHKLIRFSPHIYTQDEITRYFYAVDTFKYGLDYRGALIFPLLMRIIYCCGTRLGETLYIQKKDVNLSEGIIKLTHTKNGKERYIVLTDELNAMMKNYAEKVFWTLKDKNSFIFRRVFVILNL